MLSTILPKPLGSQRNDQKKIANYLQIKLQSWGEERGFSGLGKIVFPANISQRRPCVTITVFLHICPILFSIVTNSKNVHYSESMGHRVSTAFKACLIIAYILSPSMYIPTKKFHRRSLKESWLVNQSLQLIGKTW